MSFEMNGIPVDVKYSPDATVSRLSYEFTFRMNHRLLNMSRSTILFSSISVATSSAAFTCALKFVIDPYLEGCDVVLGSEWKDACDAKCIFPLSLATIPVYESDDMMDCAFPASLAAADPPAAPHSDHLVGGGFLPNDPGTGFSSSDSATHTQESDSSFSFQSLPYYPFRKRIDSSK